MSVDIAGSTEAIDRVQCDALVVGAYPDRDGPVLGDAAADVDRTLNGMLAEQLRDAKFNAKVGDVTIVPTLGRLPAKRIVVAGLGSKDAVDAAALRRTAGAAARRVAENEVVASALHQEVGDDGGTAAVVEGLLLGSYRFTKYKSDPKPSKLRRIVVVEAREAALERGRLFAEATALARDLINEPAGTLTPQVWAERAQETARGNGLSCKVWDENELADEGFGGLLGVAQGSSRPPRLIELRYVPDGPVGKVAIVGKGITFDSGGLSIKDAKGMETMKTDMSGGAAVMGAMSVLDRLGGNVEVLGLIPATENMPSGTAIKPGDVIVHHGGHTSEVLNTDAEGRLVLADALVYAARQQVDAIVDAATLTGAMMVALGSKITGFFSNDDALAAELEDAARAAGERLWRMPLFDDYRKDLDSEVADVKNTGPRWGGAIMAALFLKDFVSDGQAWAHLDIAGPARAESDYEEVAKGGTGVATRTFLRWIEGRGNRA